MPEYTLQQLSELFENAADEFETMDLSEPLEECAKVAQADFESNLLNQQDPDGHPWPPTKTGRPALRDNNELLSNLRGDGAGSIISADDRGVAVGINSPEWAGFHNAGRGVPQREFIGMREGIEDCVDIIADAVVENILESL